MIPTYNQENYIEQAIKSALKQTYPNIEVIVGDDFSTDSTRSIVSKIKDSRLKYFRNPYNFGRTNNYKNLLYNHATGDYVLNLDGDDYYTDSTFVLNAVKLINKKEKIVMVVAKATTKFKKFEEISLIPKNKILSGINILKNIPNREYLFMHMTTLYDRKIAIKINFYSSSTLSSDWHSLYRLSLHGNTAFLDANVGIWRKHESNETDTSDPEVLLKNLNIWKEIYDYSLGFGMNSYLAYYLREKSIAFFSHLSCIRVSMNGNLKLLKFILSIFKNHKLSVIMLFLIPKYNIRIFLSLIGYYRK